jgi:hypothetical protein
VGCKGKGERKCKAVEIVRKARGKIDVSNYKNDFFMEAF